jgi:phage gpG-like protein
VRFELELAGDRQVSREILRVSERAGDAAPVFRSIADYLRSVEKRQFDSHGLTGSGGWAPLATSTLLSKYGVLHGTHLRHGQFTRKALRASMAILVETGALRDSLTSAGDEHHREIVRSDELIFGTSVSYAKYHQHGTRRMPRRRPLELSETQRKQVIRMLQRWIIKGELG